MPATWGVRLKYIADVNRAAAVELAVKHRAEVRGAEAIFADEAITAIVIASSTDTHADLIQGGAAAGKAIFCEKPVDLDLVRARACAQAVGKTGVACMIRFQRRFGPTVAAP